MEIVITEDEGLLSFDDGLQSICLGNHGHMREGKVEPNLMLIGELLANAFAKPGNANIFQSRE